MKKDIQAIARRAIVGHGADARLGGRRCRVLPQ